MFSRRAPVRSDTKRPEPLRPTRRLRTTEVVLGLLGISLLATAGFSRLNASRFQREQGREFSIQDRQAGALQRAPADRPSPAPVVDPRRLGRIEIPRVGVSAIVSEGIDDATLEVAVGRIPGTARPGEAGNMALAGHRDSFFRGLEKIRLRDVIEFRTPGRSDRYLVTSTAIVPPSDTSVLDPADEAVLTLVTCYPFAWIGRAPNRFVVRAQKIAD